MAGFVPKLPGGVANPNSSGDQAAGDTPDGSNVAWVAAPATSHLWGWKFLDARAYPFLKKFPGRLGGVSVLVVRFRTKEGGPGVEYHYGFSDPDAGRAVADALASSAHPFGQVLHPRVIKTGVPYTRA